MPTITLHPFPPEQVMLLKAWLATPHVKRWWKPHWTEGVVAAFEAGDGAPDWMRPWRIDLDGRPIGYAHDYDVMQDGDVWQPVEGVGPGTRGLDILIGEEDAVNRKHGRAVIGALTVRIFETPEYDRVVADPHPDQWGAIIAFQKAGYRERGRHVFPSGQTMVMTAAKAIWKPRPGSTEF